MGCFLRKTEREGQTVPAGQNHLFSPGASPGILLLALLVTLSYLLVSPFNVADGINPWLDGDYGMFTHNPLRVLNGDLLYRDFWTVYGPVPDHLIALIFILAGDSLRALRVALALTGALTALLMFRLARSVASSFWAVIVILLAFVIGPVTVNFPYPSWFCIPLGLGMVLFDHRGRRKGRISYIVVSGALCGLIFSIKPNWGLCALLALMCTQSLNSMTTPERRTRISIQGPTAIVALAALLGCFPLLSLLLIRDHLATHTVGFFTLPAAMVILPGIRLITRNLREGRTALDLVFPLVSQAGFALMVAPWGVYLLLRLGGIELLEVLVSEAKLFARAAYLMPPRPTVESLVLILLCCGQGLLIFMRRNTRPTAIFAMLVCWTLTLLLGFRMVPFIKEGLFRAPVGYGSYDGWAFKIVSYVPLSVHMGLAFVFMGNSQQAARANQNDMQLLFSLWLYSVATTHILYPIADVYHVLWLMPSVMVLGCGLGFLSLQYWERKHRSVLRSWSRYGSLISMLLLAALLFFFFGLPLLTYLVEINPSPLRIHVRQFSDIRSPRAGILMPKHRADALSEVVSFLTHHTESDEYIFDMTGSFFYFLADRPNPTRWCHFSYPQFMTSADVAEILHQLERLKPGIIVSSYEADRNFSLSYPELHRYIRNHYRIMKTSQEYIILVLNERA